MSSFGPYLAASFALGFIKGFMSKDQAEGFNAEMDIIGPVKEELLYRGGPLWLFPELPMGATTITFAADHIAHDRRQALTAGEPPPTPAQVAARLGDTFLGGLIYEGAFRASGIGAAVVSHVVHNMSIGWGQRLRNGRAPKRYLPCPTP